MKKLATLTLVAAMAFMATGCAKPVVKQWQAAGGSRADATVTVGYSYNPNTEIPKTNDSHAYNEAVERCRAWGYQDAEPFGLISSNCSNMVYGFGGPQCLEMLVTQQYQCLGQGNRTPQKGDPDFVSPVKPVK